MFKKVMAFIALSFMMLGSAISVSALHYATVVIVGDLGGGKTEIWNRVQGVPYGRAMHFTNDFRFFQSGLANTDINLKIWDTPGLREHRREVVDFVVNANFVFIVHDLTQDYNQQARDYIDGIYRDVRQNMANDGKIIFVGSKSDDRARITTWSENRDVLRSCCESANQQVPGSSEFMILSAQNDVGVYCHHDNQNRNVLQIIEHYITQSVGGMQLPTRDRVTVVPPIRPAATATATTTEKWCLLL
jgi:GTPase SAR1 family protein